MSNGNSDYKTIKHVRDMELPRAFLERAENNVELSDSELSTLKSRHFEVDMDAIQGKYTIKQYPRYGTFDGGDETEFLCQLWSMDEDIPYLSEEEKQEFESGNRELTSASLDGFLLNQILRYNFEEQDWENASEHIGHTAGQSYAFCDNDKQVESFFDRMMKITDEMKAPESAPPEPEV